VLDAEDRVTRLVVALCLAAASLVLASCGGGTTSTSETSTASAAVFTVEVKGGKPVGGIVHAQVKQGTKVALVVHSEVADEVHVHGYDLHEDVAAGGSARIAFMADIAGIFEVELESRKLQIASLEVR
jgi:hypothetical protein